MAENKSSMNHNTDNEPIIRPPNPLSSIISKFTEVVNFRFPPPPVKIDVMKVETESKAAGDESKPPVSVRFPDANSTTVVPLKLEAEEMERDNNNNNNNPVFIWQVYAIGGFFIMKWVLARWKARRPSKKSSDEDSPPPPPPASAAEGNE